MRLRQEELFARAAQASAKFELLNLYKVKH